MDAFQAAMQSESAAEAMEYDGVLPETPVILVEAWFVLPPLSTHTAPDLPMSMTCLSALAGGGSAPTRSPPGARRSSCSGVEHQEARS